MAQTTPKMNTSQAAQAQPGSSSQFASQLPQILVPGSIMLKNSCHSGHAASWSSPCLSW